MQVKEYRTTLEKINLTLEDYIDNAFVMFGKSKSGMTSSAHFLCHNKLTGYKLNGQPMVEVEGSQLRQQKIGKSYSTETLIPNKFQIKVNSIKQKVLLIDGTGFGNTHESLGILSSGYAHLRIFQRVRSMKFIICFDQKDLFGNGMPFLETLRQFIEFFKIFDTIKNDIMQSCVFLFTKVTDRQNLRSHLSHFANKFKSQLQDEKQKQIKDFVNHVINKDKIFYIKKAEVGQIIQSSTLMNKIDQKIQKWWTRDGIDESDTQNMFSSIDMSLIKVSLIRQLLIACLLGVKSRDQFRQLMRYYLQLRQFIFKSQIITDLFNLLVEDFMSNSDYRCSIFQAMRKFVQQKTLNNNQIELGYQLNTVKTGKIQRIYQDTPLKSYNMQVKTMRLAVKKFQTLQKIERQCRQFCQIQSHRIQSRFGSLLKSLQNIFKYLHELALWYNKQQQVKKYYYEIFQIINQLRCICLMINNQDKLQNQILNTISYGFPGQLKSMRSIKDHFGWVFIYQNEHYSSIQILKLYIKRIDITKLQQQKDYVIDQQFVQAMFNQNMLDDHQCQYKLIDLIQRYSDMVLERMEVQQQQQNAIKIDNNRRLLRQKLINYRVIYTKRLKKHLLKNLFMAIQWSYSHYQLNCQNNQQAKKRLYTTKIKRLTSNLANLLLYKNEDNLAIKLFQSVNMVSSVCSTYEKMISKLQRNLQITKQLSSIINIKLSYVDYLIGHMRVNKAIQVLSSIMSSQRLAQQQLIQISSKLSELRDKQFISNKIQQYNVKVLSQKKYFTPLLISDQSLIQSINEVIEKCDNNSDNDSDNDSDDDSDDDQDRQQQQQQFIQCKNNNVVDQLEDGDIDLDDIDNIDDLDD